MQQHYASMESSRQDFRAANDFTTSFGIAMKGNYSVILMKFMDEKTK